MADACIMDVVAQKYAKAFYKVYGSLFDEAAIEKLKIFADYLLSNKGIFAYLNLPVVTDDLKIATMEALCDRADIHPSIKNLIQPLLQRRRIELFSKVLCLFIVLFRKHHNIMACKIIISCELDVKEKNFIKQAIGKALGVAIIAEFITDSSLISGIRIQSETCLWESSLAKRLKMLENDILQRVRLW